MRKYQHYGLRADEELARAARQILEHSGMEKFCKDLDSPDDPPVLTADKISFAVREHAGRGRATAEVLILGAELYDTLLAEREERKKSTDKAYNELIPGTDVTWYEYGDTNALGCENEMWTLLVWALLHGYEQQLARCYIRNLGQLHEMAPMYEAVFGEALEGELLEELCEKYGTGIHPSATTLDIVNVIHGNHLKMTVDSLRFASESISAAREVNTCIHELADEMTQAAFPTLFNDKYPPSMFTLARHVTCEIADCDLSMDWDELLKIGTGGNVSYDDVVKTREGTHLVLPESVKDISKTVDVYVKLWKKCYDSNLAEAEKNGLLDEDDNVFSVSSAADEETKKQEEIRNKLPRKRALAMRGTTSKVREWQKEQFQAKIEEKPLAQWVDEALYATGFDSVFESIRKGVPAEDAIA